MGHFGDPLLWFDSTDGSKGELLSEAGKSFFREKTNPSSSNHSSSAVLNKYPLISHPRAKTRLFFSDLSIKQLLQPNKNHLPSHTSAGTWGSALRG